ncbi:nickel pincer cofactor biosynthesis protein LarC [Crateriforma spongiae]|uniref:nickel pincer cofactor biosynthesis protein LarC n=1 Tax=Crateriforma spongiae TaxID=2724528 RepID=UPI001446FEB6|nr:nickel pincer cofactor biosynthesis protein LarC [Crateriforma spongiae]
MARVLYFDCLSGISGDMTLGALIDLGVDVNEIQDAVRSMGLPDISITADEVKKKGFRAVHVNIEHPPEHAHRHLHHIEEMIDAGDKINDDAKALAKKIFHVVAEAEAKVHGTTLQKVHFHEVGAIDSIADIVGTAVAMTQLGVDAVMASAVPTGTGEVTIAHGRVSIPAPATAEILCDVPIAGSSIRAELTTPTGAAILKATSRGFGPLPSMAIQKVGYGAGTMDLDAQANVLRVYQGQIQDDAMLAAAGTQFDQVAVMETNVDDCSAEQVADACRRLLDAGALDVFQIPCTMKKGRAAVILNVIAPPSRVGVLESILFRHTTSIGIRKQTMNRSKLVRRAENVDTAWGPVRGKVVQLPDGQERFTVEHDDAAEIADASGRDLAEIRRAAEQAWAEKSSDDQAK